MQCCVLKPYLRPLGLAQDAKDQAAVPPLRTEKHSAHAQRHPSVLSRIGDSKASGVFLRNTGVMMWRKAVANHLCTSHALKTLQQGCQT